MLRRGTHGVVVLSGAVADDPFPALAAQLGAKLDAAFDFDPAYVSLATGISQVNDRSDNGYHVTQGTGANQPAYTAAGLDGHGYGTFDGDNDRLSGSVTNLAKGDRPVLYVVGRYLAPADGLTHGMAGIANPTNAVLAVYKSSDDGRKAWMHYDDGGTGAADSIDVGAATANWGLFDNRPLAAAHTGGVDGSDTTSAVTAGVSARADSGTDTQFIGAFSSGSTHGNVDISYVLRLNDAPTAAEHTAIKTFFAARYPSLTIV